MDELKRHVPDAAATEKLGAAIGEHLPQVRLIYLHGPLGAGKTTLVRGLLRGLGNNETVKSPTFTLVEPYAVGRGNLYHFDLYRIEHAEELEYMGLRDYLLGTDICVVEWPDRARGLLPPPDLDVMIQPANTGRSVRLMARTNQGQLLLAALAQ